MCTEFCKTSTLAWCHFTSHLFVFSFCLPLLFFTCCVLAFQSQLINPQQGHPAGYLSACPTRCLSTCTEWQVLAYPKVFTGLCPPNACTVSQFLHVRMKSKQQHSPRWSWGKKNPHSKLKKKTLKCWEKNMSCCGRPRPPN